MYQISFKIGWDEHYRNLSPDIRSRVVKKIQQLENLESIRHLQLGLPFFVVQVGQFRICFEQKENIRTIVFVGNHKQYEKWYSEQ